MIFLFGNVSKTEVRLGPESREKWLLPPAQTGRSVGSEGEVTMAAHH